MITRHLSAAFLGITAILLVMTWAHSDGGNGPAMYPFFSWVQMYSSVTVDVDIGMPPTPTGTVGAKGERD